MSELVEELAAREHRALADGNRELSRVLGDARRQILALEGEVLRVRDLINRDRTGLAAALAEIRTVVRGFWWIAEGSWGSYSYEEQTERTLRREAAGAFEQVQSIAKRALETSGSLAHEAFHQEPLFKEKA